MIGKLNGQITFNADRTQNITLAVNGDFRQQWDKLKDKKLDIDIKVHREKRSLSANAYPHVLINKIAEAMNVSDTEIKNRLVTDYGVFAKDKDGSTIGFKLPASVDVSDIYPYTRCFDTRCENGKMFNCYIVLKRTRDMDSKEISRVIDGAIYEAKQLGIETDTPDKLAQYKAEWLAYEQEHHAG